MDTMLWIVVSLFACIGAAELLGRFLFMRRPRSGVRATYQIITLYDDPPQVEAQLNHCLKQMGWNGAAGFTVLVDMGLGEESLGISEKLMGEMYGAFLCTAEELPRLLRRLDLLSFEKESRQRKLD